MCPFGVKPCAPYACCHVPARRDVMRPFSSSDLRSQPAVTTPPGAFGAPLEYPPVRLRRKDAPISVSSPALIPEPPGPPFVQHTTGTCSSRQRTSLVAAESAYDRTVMQSEAHGMSPVLSAGGPGWRWWRWRRRRRRHLVRIGLTQNEPVMDEARRSACVFDRNVPCAGARAPARARDRSPPRINVPEYIVGKGPTRWHSIRATRR
jgi:hypothetical protein